MKIGIISDTHDNSSYVLGAAEVLRGCEVDYILHAGDIVSAATARVFAAINGAKFIAVLGNCDIDKDNLRESISGLGGQLCETVYNGEIAQRRILMAHKPAVLRGLLEKERFDLGIYGHTHKQAINKTGRTLIINAGPGCVTIVDLDNMKIEEMVPG